MKSFHYAVSGAFTALGIMMCAPRAHAADKLFEFGAGIYGAGGVVGLTKPSDTTVVQPGGAAFVDNSYPGFFGGTGGAGIMLDARFFGAVGLEVDFYYAARDKGAGDLTIGGTQKFNLEIGQSALHIPILLKGVIPVGPVRPFLAIGPDIVVPGTASLVITPEPGKGSTAYGAKADSYILWTAALGAEIRLPVPKLDIRIPFSFRFAKNFGTSDKISDRRDAVFVKNGENINFTSIAYKSEWELQGLFTLGAAIYF
jgi:hypothetical protein